MLPLEVAQFVVVAALTEARRINARPLGIVVIDSGGHLVTVARENGASNARIEIARGKANGAIAMGADSRILAERAAGNPNFFASISHVIPGGMVLSAGGVIIRDGEAIIGAVGVSGDTSDIDEQCAIAGITAAAEHIGKTK